MAPQSPTNTARTTASGSPAGTSVSSPSTPVTSTPASTATTTSNAIVPPAGTSVPPTSTPLSNTTAPLKSSDFKPGAVAGVAVGTAIVGLLLGALIAFFLFRKLFSRRPSRPSSRRRHPKPLHGAKYDQQHQPQGPPPVSLEDHLPQPVEDRKLVFEVATFSTLIEQHVENFYHKSSVNPEDVEALEASFPRGLDIQVKRGLAADPETRWAALRQYIAAVALFCISLDGDPETTFMPKEVVAVLGTVPAAEGAGPAFPEAYNTWRTLTAYLLRPTPTAEPTESAITRVLSAINVTLAPFVIPETDQERTKNLRDLLRRAAKLGLLLFEQKENWTFCWAGGNKGGGERRGMVLVFPALLRGSGYVARGADFERVLI